MKKKTLEGTYFNLLQISLQNFSTFIVFKAYNCTANYLFHNEKNYGR